MDVLTAIFGRTAEDVKYYASVGFNNALCLDDPDALQVALQTAEGRFNLANTDMFISPPYPEFECPGYITLQDEEAAMGIQEEVLRSGFECTRVKDCTIQPLPRYF